MFGQHVHFMRFAPKGNDYAQSRYTTQAIRVSEVIDVRQMDFRNNVVRGHGRPRKVLEPERVLTDAEWPPPWLRG